ncbi:MAG: TatD family hydrolase [Anaerolineales bacterium]|nr:TatD family hydrolase [Anaerolineales bacterium]
MISKNSPTADTHCHLTAKVYDSDRNEVIQRALDSGIRWMVIPGMDLASSRQAVELAQEYTNIYAAVGIHPHNADGWTSSHSLELTELANSEHVVAIGEIGLDYYRNYSTRENQMLAFRSQLDLATQNNLPVIIHNRDATKDVMAELEFWISGISETLKTKAGVLHAFSADLETAERAIQTGFYIGIAGPISYQSATDLQEIAAKLPITRIITETDSPFLTPHPNRGKRNEPSNVNTVVEHLSIIIKKDYDSTAEITSKNATTLFGWKNGKN